MSGSWRKWILVLWTLSQGASGAPATSDIVTPRGFTTLKDAAQKRNALGLDPYFADRAGLQKNLQKMKVAILDVGFGDITPANVETQLTRGSKIISKYDKGECAGQQFPFLPDARGKYLANPHGMHMAQSHFGVTGFFKNAQKYLLYNANGIAAFRCAVRDLIDVTKPQIVLFSANWEMLGNFNGTNLVNDLVAEAVDEGILWVNAAGNYGGLVYNVAAETVKAESGTWLQLGGSANPYYLGFKNTLDDTPVTIKLTWTDDGSDRLVTFRVHPAEVLKDADARKLGVSVPVEEELVPGKKKVYGSELKLNLKGRGGLEYYIAASVDKGTFTARDNIRITILHDKMDYFDPTTKEHKTAIAFVDKTRRGREIMDPGSGAGLTIGSSHKVSAMGPTMDGRGKPEILMEEYVASFTDEHGALGTSYSAAYFAAIATVMKATFPKLKQEDFLRFRNERPTELLANEGWEFGDAVRKNLHGVEAKLAETLRNEIGESFLGVKDREGQKLFLLLKGMDNLTGYAKLPAEVKNSPEDYLIYLWVKKTPTKKWEKVTKRGQDRVVTVRNGYWEYDTKYETVRGQDRVETIRDGYWRKKYVGSYPYLVYDFSTGQIGRLDYHQQEWVPPVTRNVPTYRTVEKKVPRWVEPVTRSEPTYYTVNEQVDGEPIKELKIIHIDKDAEKHPVATHGGALSDYALVRAFEVASAVDAKFVLDGTENDPRFFRAPSPSDVTKTIGR